jgi:glyoxylate reductase
MLRPGNAFEGGSVAIPRVVVTRQPPGNIDALFDQVADTWMWRENRPIPRDTLIRRLIGVDGLYCMLTDVVDEALLAGAGRLRAVSNMAVGVDNIDLASCTARGIPVGHTPDVLTETTADAAFGLLIAAARRFKEGIQHVESGAWGEWDPSALLGYDLHGSTLGIVGLGRIGSAVARRAAGFGMKVLYSRRNRNRIGEAGSGLEFRSFADLLAESDHVVVLVGLNPQTTGMFDRSAFEKMKPTATLVNASRGPIVDTDALADALEHGDIAAAGLDVTDPEPIPSDHRLVLMPNCLIVPHIASATVRTRVLMGEMAAGNLMAALGGKQMPHCANPEVYG